jgi:hypothetical protein
MAESQHAEAGTQPAPNRVERTREQIGKEPTALVRRAVAPSFQGGRIDPRRLTPQAILALQRVIGNAAVNQLLPRVASPSPAAEFPLQRRHAMSTLRAQPVAGGFDLIRVPESRSDVGGMLSALQRMKVICTPGGDTSRSFSLQGHTDNGVIPLATFAVYTMPWSEFSNTFKVTFDEVTKATGVSTLPGLIASFAEPKALGKGNGYGAAAAYFAARWTMEHGLSLIVVAGAVDTALGFYSAMGFTNLPTANLPSFVGKPDTVMAKAKESMAKYDLQVE